MSGMGTGYDLAVTIYSPDGRLYQIEYANKAVESSGTAVGICCKDGVVLAVEKLVDSKLQEEQSNTRIFNVDRNAGLSITGWKPDGRPIVNKARSEARGYLDQFGHRIPGRVLSERLSASVHFHTLYMSSRPLGITTLLAAYDFIDGPQLYQIDPSGESWGYKACATGKGRQGAKSELEKLNLDTLTIQEALKEAARIIYHVHDDSKDRQMELELSWICADTKFEHRKVTGELYDQVVQYAKDQTKKTGTPSATGSAADSMNDDDEDLSSSTH